MKKIVFVFLSLALVLTACSAPTPATIIITVIPTNEPVVATDVPATDVPATDVPATDVPAATDTPVPAQATDTPAPVAPTDTPEPAQKATNTRPPAVGGAVFDNITRSGDTFSLRCSPGSITFSLTSINIAITSVYIYYRVIDKNSTLAPGAFISGGEMTSDKQGNFTMEFSAIDVKDDLRVANGWFDYQFVGLNKVGNVVGRSEKFVKEVTFTLDCP